MHLGWLFTASLNSPSLIWPLTGIAAAALLRAGHGYSAAVFFGTAAALAFRQQWPVAIGLALGETLAAAGLAALWFYRRGGTRAALVAVAILLVASLYSAAWLSGIGRIGLNSVPAITIKMLLGHLAGVALFAPLIVLWPAAIQKSKRRTAATSFAILLALNACLFLAAFSRQHWLPALLVFPPLVISWVALRHGQWLASLMAAFTLGCMAWGFVRSQGAFSVMPPDAQPFAIWAYAMALALAAWAGAWMRTEQRRLAALARQGEEHYKALVEDNPALICRFTADGYLAFANETFRRFFGMGSSATAGANFFHLTGLATDASFLKTLANMRAGDAPATAERPMISEFRSAWFRWSARVVKESSGQGAEFHAVGIDVTDEVRAEEERRRIEEHAVQAQKMESIGVMAGGIAHEFNNLLAGVLGNAELAQQVVDQPEQLSQLLADVRAGSQRAAELTQQLLNYAMRRNAPKEPADLAGLVRGMSDLLGVAVPKRCHIRLEFEEGLPLVIADEAKLRQLLLTLTANAGEASAESGGPVIVHGRSVHFDPKRDRFRCIRGHLHAGWYVALEIEDHGCGMSGEVLRQAFEPFFTTRYPGRGLGLPAAAGIVHDHDGAIALCSHPGKGTVVRVFLPPHDPRSAAVGPPEAFPAHAPDCPHCAASMCANIQDSAAVRRAQSPPARGSGRQTRGRRNHLSSS